MAYDLAMARQRQAAEGTPWHKLSSSDLHDLRRQGVISQDFLDKALDYLSKGDGANRASSSTPAVGTTAPPTSTAIPAAPLSARSSPDMYL